MDPFPVGQLLNYTQGGIVSYQAELLSGRVRNLPDPDDIGTTEYRAAYDFAWDVLDTAMEDSDPVACMAEVIDGAIAEMQAVKRMLCGGGR